jgi:hypothetical protein
MNIDDEGRRKGAANRKERREATPIKLTNKQMAAEEFAKRMGDRRYDEEGMVVKFKNKTRPQQLELFGPEVDLGTKPKT